MIFGIVERQRDRRKILALILSIKLCYKEKVKILLSKNYGDKKLRKYSISKIKLLHNP